MFFKEDRTFREIQRRSVEDWLSQMEMHDDLLARGGVKVTREYIQFLQDQIHFLQEQGQLKDQFLRKLKEDKRNLIREREEKE
ncbi:MAG: hypothetical protein Q4E53_06625 [Eubacteriales bacterium]|nr:hypothetical protein [Eubacteriales bacterium]